MTENKPPTLVSTAEAQRPFHPFCKECGWRKGGPDSWNGNACKCGHSEPPIRMIQAEPQKEDR